MRFNKNSRIFSNVENFRNIVETSFSSSEVIRKMGYKPSGGMHVYLKSVYKELNIDISHFLGQTWNKGKIKEIDSRVRAIAEAKSAPDEVAFSYNSGFSNGVLLRRLVSAQKRKYKCDECGISNWNGKAIRLHLDHINGNRMDNTEGNLRIICPNCHSQTSTFSRGQRSASKTYEKGTKWWQYLSLSEMRPCSPTGKRCIPEMDKVGGSSPPMDIKKFGLCKECKVPITNRGKHGKCHKCQSIARQKVQRPVRETLLKQIVELGYRGTARLYGVSDNAIRKWSL